MQRQPEAGGVAPTRLRRGLHWLIAAGVIALVGIGLVMTRLDVAAGGDAGAIARRIWLYSLHKTLGLGVAVLVAWRLVLVLRAGLLRGRHRPAEVIAARFVAGVLLTALVLMPLTGLLQHLLVRGSAPIWGLPSIELFAIDPGTAARFGAAHRMLGWLLIAAITLHIAGALKHHFLDRDGTLVRMLRDGEGTRDAAIGTLPAGARRAPAVGTVVALAMAIGGYLTGAPHQPPAATTTLSAGMWIMDRGKSRLEVEATQGGEAFKARFERFDVRIVLDPERLSEAEIQADIDVASFASGLPDRDTVARDGEWLDAARFPLARYSSRRITRGADGRYRAEGVLRIRDWEAPVDLTFTLAITGDAAHALGEARFDRFDLKLGTGATGGEDMAGRGIRIVIDIHARRAATAR